MTTDLITVRVQAPAIPEPEGNLDEVQANIDSLLAAYTGRVYTVDEIKSAKADRAQVNRWDKQLGEASTALKKHYLAALDKPLARITAMRGQVKQVSAAIDAQVKAVEEAEKRDKRLALEQVYRDAAGDDLAPLVPFDRVLDPRWLNKTVTLAAASKELRKGLETHREALRIIRDTCGEDAEACTTEYLRALSLNDALNEYRRRQQAREAQAQAEAARRRKRPSERLHPSPYHRHRKSGKSAQRPPQPPEQARSSHPTAGWTLPSWQIWRSRSRRQSRSAAGTASGWSSPPTTSGGLRRPQQSAASSSAASSDERKVAIWHLRDPARPQHRRPHPQPGRRRPAWPGRRRRSARR